MTFDEYETQLLADGLSLPGPAEKCRAVWDWYEELAADKSVLHIDLDPESDRYGWLYEEKKDGGTACSGARTFKFDVWMPSRLATEDEIAQLRARLATHP